MPTSATNASSSSSSQAYTSPTISAAPKITQQPSASFSKPPMPTNNYSQFCHDFFLLKYLKALFKLKFIHKKCKNIKFFNFISTIKIKKLSI